MAEQNQQLETSDSICEPRNTVIVTGFGPFGKHNINASWEAVRLLPSTEIEKELGISLVTEQISVSYEDVEKKIPQMWDDYKPLLVIHVGVSEYASTVTLEQVAHKSGYEREDIHGSTPPCQECCVGSSPVKRSTVDIEQLNNEINGRTSAVKTQLSENAGRYLCEYIYYTSLSIDDSRSLFIHVPPLDKPYSAAKLSRGLVDIIKCLVRLVRDLPDKSADTVLPDKSAVSVASASNSESDEYFFCLKRTEAN